MPFLVRFFDGKLTKCFINLYIYIEQIRDAQYWIFADIRYADMFQLILADSQCRYQYISFGLETTPSLSCVEIIS